MKPILHLLPGLIFWGLVTIAAGVSYHRGYLSWSACGGICVFAFAVAVLINQREFKGKDDA